jgi:hypothetical protein
MLTKYLKFAGDSLSAFLFGEVVDDVPCVQLHPLPWRADGFRVYDSDGVFIFEVCSATDDESLRKALVHSIVSSVNKTGWWDYRRYSL